MFYYFWLVIFILFTIVFTLPLLYWLKDELYLQNMKFKMRTKIILSILAVILYIATIASTTRLPLICKPESTVSITEISDVYKSNESAKSSYYISNEHNNEIYEIKVDKLSKGNTNYIITRTYEDGSTSNELVVKEIKELSSFNK